MSDPADLPTFVPSRETVELAAERLAIAIDRTADWPGMGDHVKNFYLRVALDVLNGTGQRLIADALVHVGENVGDYGFAEDEPLDLKWYGDDLRRQLDLATL